MLPRVIMHNAVSVDGRVDWISPDLGQFYGLASTWREDVTLAGSETILTAEAMDGVSPEEVEASELQPSNPDDSRPLLAIVDSRGRLRNWLWWRKQPYWRDVVALCSHSTPSAYLDYLRERQVNYIVAGDDHVDLRVVLEEFNARYGAKVVRVDSGGTLNGALLRAGLVDEVSLMIDPSLVGGTTARSIFRAPDLTSPEGVIKLRLIGVERLGGEAVWLRYEVIK